MANIPAKVFIKIESSKEQQETLNKSRKTFKVLQKAAIDKENLAGRMPLGKSFTKAKSDDFSGLELTKRKKFESKTTQTEAYQISSSSSSSLSSSVATATAPLSASHKSEGITEKDLTTNENPGEHYWEVLAEKRRHALNETLDENRRLYERIEGLEEELNTSRQMLEEAKNLVEVLTEMLNENDEPQEQQEQQQEEIDSGEELSEKTGLIGTGVIVERIDEVEEEGLEDEIEQESLEDDDGKVKGKQDEKGRNEILIEGK